jgi:diguanylate cyclase
LRGNDSRADPRKLGFRGRFYVLLFFVVVAVLNLALGVCVAIVHSHDWPDFAQIWQRIRPPSPKVSVEASAPAVETKPLIAPLEEESSTVDASDAVPQLELPEGWRERLAADHIVPKLVWEAVLQFVRVELETHRARWVSAEQSLRAAMHINTDAAARAALEPLRQAMTGWLAWLGAFMTALKSLRPRLEEQRATVDRLEELLLDQVGRIESLVSEQEGTLEGSDKELAVRKILREYAAIFEMAHALRDFVLDQLAIQLHSAGLSPAEVPADWQRDPVSLFPNRLGLESLLVDWLKHDPTRKRPVSGAFIEIDRLGKLNERLGVQQSDQVIRAFAKLVEGVVRSDRGDRVARVAGPTMFVLLSDAGVVGAKAAVERIRQTVEAATFQTRREEFTLAANCSVCDFLPDDTTPVLLARLRAGIIEAKRGGRNRTALDEGQGPVLFDAQPIQVRAQSIQVQ